MIARIVFIAKCVMIGDVKRVEKEKRKNARKIPKAIKKIEKNSLWFFEYSYSHSIVLGGLEDTS